MPATVGSSQAGCAADPRLIAAHPREEEAWRLWLPEGLSSGVHAETPGQVSGLLHAGESWTNPTLSIDPHSHPGWELYLQLHGASRWLVGGRILALAPGWAVAVPPGMEHGHDRAGGPHARHHYT